MRKLGLALALWLASSAAFAQNAGWPPPAGAIAFLCVYNASPPTLSTGNVAFAQCDSGGKLLVSASVSATVTGFAPGGTFANLTATGSSADVALPAGAVVAAQNTGTTAVSCNLTVGAGSASASQNIIQPASTVYLTVGSNTHGSCIDQTGSASNVVVFSGGAGLGTGFGGGGGSGGGGAITAASGSYASGALSSGSMVDLGSQADAACGTDNGSCSAIALIKRTNQNVTTLNTTAGSAIPAGTNNIGTVMPYAQSGSFTSGVTGAMTGTTSTSLLGAPGGSLHNYLTHIVCTNSHATVGTFVVVQDGSGGTTIYEAYAAAVGGGFSLTLPVALKQPTAATALYVADVTTGANVICSASGYTQ